MKTLIEADRETEDSSLEHSTSSNNQLTPISKSESTSVSNNNRAKRIELLSIERKGKRLKFMINGNRFFRGIRYCLCTERIRCFDVLLEDLNRLIKDVNLPKGVQYIYSYSMDDKLSRNKLESLDEFKDNHIYICSSNDNFIDLDYGSISQGFDCPAGGGIGGFNQLSKSTSCTAADQRIKTMASSPFNPHNQQSSGSPTNEFIRPKLVNIIINGPKPREVIKLLLNKRSVHSYDQLLTDIQAKSKTLFTPIRRVYHLNGKKVTKLKDFFSNQDIFIVSASDKRNNQDFDIHPEECNNIHFGRFLLGKGNVSLSTTASTSSSTIPSTIVTLATNNNRRYNNINDPTITSTSSTSSPIKSISRQSNTIISSPSTSINNKTVSTSQEIDSSSSLSSSSSSSVWLENVNLRDLSLENDVFTPDIYDPVSSTTTSTMTNTNNNNYSNQQFSYQRKYLNNNSTLIPMSSSRVSLNEYNNQRDYPVRRNTSTNTTTSSSNRNSIGGISSNNINYLGENNISYGQSQNSSKHKTSSSSSTSTSKDKIKQSPNRKHTNNHNHNNNNNNTLRASDGNIVYQDPLKSTNRTNQKHHHHHHHHHKSNHHNNNNNNCDNINNDKNTKRKTSTPSIKFSRIPILQGLTQLPRRINSTINCAKLVSSNNNNHHNNNNNNNNNKITSSNNYLDCSPSSNHYSSTLSLLFPREINRKYSVGNIIGDGNFAVVHECTNRCNNVKYAMKIINKSKCRGSEVSKSEVAILRKINHPFIIQLIEDYDFPNEMYLVMELVAGGDLYDAITSKNMYSEKEARGMVTNLLQALAYLHSMNICHRDIKPENLLVSSKKDGKMFIKLADFGLAVKILPGQKLYEVCGTPIYVAPEILAETGYDFKVDVWAVGVIAYILLCGYPPFVSKNNDNDELFDLILKGSFEFLHQYWSTVSSEAKNFISKLLIVNQHARLTSLEALRDSWISEDINPYW